MAGSSASPFVCFLDESATDAEQIAPGVLGGLVMTRAKIPEFEAAWSSLIARYRIIDGIHVSAFGPTGKNSHLTDPEYEALYGDAVTLINQCRACTFGCMLDNRKIERAFSSDARAIGTSTYGLAFLMCVVAAHKSAVDQKYQGRIDYVLDVGNKFRYHVEGMRDSINAHLELQRFQVGEVTFSTDADKLPLQAADVVSWATRRRAEGRHFRGVLRPLEGLFDEANFECSLADEPLRRLAEVIARLERTTDSSVSA